MPENVGSHVFPRTGLYDYVENKRLTFQASFFRIPVTYSIAMAEYTYLQLKPGDDQANTYPLEMQKNLQKPSPSLAFGKPSPSKAQMI